MTKRKGSQVRYGYTRTKQRAGICICTQIIMHKYIRAHRPTCCMRPGGKAAGYASERYTDNIEEGGEIKRRERKLDAPLSSSRSQVTSSQHTAFSVSTTTRFASTPLSIYMHNKPHKIYEQQSLTQIPGTFVYTCVWGWSVLEFLVLLMFRSI